MIKPFFIFLFLAMNSMAYAQTFTIKGNVTDTLNNPLIAASVLLLDQDSTLLEFTQTEMDGSFKFKKIDVGDYLLKMTYVSYVPVTIPIHSNKENIDVGTIKMKEISAELMEVVIRAAKAPMKIRGDTLEYDATTFKVPEGSTLEDLLRRLPGVEIQQDGSITSEGKDVTKVTVEGKSFFGGDPKTATKNLPAEGISKVQVFDNKSEEAKITGNTTPTTDKAMNITLKDEFKKGGFGKIIVGYGTEDRAELKGNYNKFNDKHQFSIVGVANNTGRNGLNWDDYQDFMGSQSFNFDSGDLDYGFNNSGGMRFYSYGSNSDNELESSIQNSFFNSSNGGFPKSTNAGANYNYEHNKKKLGARYFYNYNANTRNTSSNATNFFNDFTTDNSRTINNDDNFNGHRAEITYEQELDTFNTIVFNANLASVNSVKESTNTNTILRNRERLTSSSEGNNLRDFNGNFVNTSAIYRRKFLKKGRFFGLNGSYIRTHADEKNTINSDIFFYDDAVEIDSSSIIRQQNDNIATKNVFKINTMYSEPLSKLFFLAGFFNYSNRQQVGDISVSDRVNEDIVQNQNLTRNYVNKFQFQKIGSSLSFSKDGFNLSTGLAFQSFGIHGNVSSLLSEGKVDKNYDAVIPFFSINLSMGRNGNASIRYVKNVQEPKINDLLPIVDNSNPLYIREGNQDLLPTASHEISSYISRSWPANGIRLYLNATFNIFDNQVIQNQTVSDDGLSYTRLENYSGGNSFWSYTGFSFPIMKNKIKGNLGGSFSSSKNFAIVNTLLNETKSTAIRPRLSIDITPSEKIGLYLSGTVGKTNTEYSLSTSRNQVIYRNDIGIEFNVGLGKDFFIASNYRHSFYNNETNGQKQDIPIINGSVYKQFLKGNRGEVRLSIYDALNKNLQFTQYAGSNTVSSSTTASLARYFMASFTYNLRGMSGKIQRDNY